MVGLTGLLRLSYVHSAHRLNSRPAFFRPPFACSQTSVRRFVSIANAIIKQKSRPEGGFLFDGRIDWTRTSDLFDPNEAFYQAELQSDTTFCCLR